MQNIDLKFNSEYLSKLMKEKNLSAAKLATELILLGYYCTDSTVRFWQMGRFPRVEALYALSVVFGVEMQNFLDKNITKGKVTISVSKKDFK